jgi:hypothetical protein
MSPVAKLAVAIPDLFDVSVLAIPLVLSMGWTESPPYFCAVAETIADIANQCLRQVWNPPPHRLDAVASTAPAEDSFSLPTRPPKLTTLCPDPARRSVDWLRRRLAKYEIFVDDFIGCSQGTAKQRINDRRVLLHTLDEVFRAVDPSIDGPY